MTIEEQLRSLARHADQHQPVITAEEILQRASGRHDPTASRRHLTIAPPAGGAGSEPVMQISDDSADAEHKTRWRSPAVAAAAIVVLGVGAIAFAVSNTTADDPDGVPQAPAPTAAPTTAAPTTTVAPRIVSGSVPGTDPDLMVTYTLPDGWVDAGAGYMARSASSVVNFWDVVNVYADGCEHTQLDPPLGPTVDDLANVWATLPGFTATTPVDIVVDGYAGKRVDYTVPDYGTVEPTAEGHNADCAENTFALWTERYGGLGPNFWAQVPGQQNRQWIIDVDGTRLVINEWSDPGTTPEQLAGMDEFLASIHIG